MDKLWICFSLLLLAFCATAQNDDSVFPDYWNDDYDTQWYSDELEKLGIIDDDNKEPERNNDDKLINGQPDVAEDDTNYNDYDNLLNRLVGLDEQDDNDNDSDNNMEKKIQVADIEEQEKRENDIDQKHDVVVDDNNYNDYDNLIDQLVDLGGQEKNENDMDKKVEEEIKDFRNENEAAPAERDGAFDVNSDYQFEDNRWVPKEEENILQVLPVASNEFADNDGSFEGKDTEPVVEPNEPIASDNNNEDESDNTDEQLSELKEVAKDINDPQLSSEIDENKNIFVETKNILNEDINKNNDFEKDSEQVNNNNEIIQDIMEETNKLLEESSDTFDVDSVGNNESFEVKKEEVLENQSQNFDEDTVDKVYFDLNEDLNKLFETWEKLKTDDVDIEQNVGDMVKQEDALDFDTNKENEDFPKSGEKYVNSFEEYVKSHQADNGDDIESLFKDDSSEKLVESEEDDQELFNMNGESKELNPDDAIKENEDVEAQPIRYLDDALVDNDGNDNDSLKQAKIDSEAKKVEVDNLSSSELENLMEQFKIAHSEDLDTESRDFDRNVAVVHMELSVDEPLIVTSPNYPSPYPTNNVIDWLFEGEGVGIEFNVVDFAVNGALGDYLLVKPGGLDASGTDGLVFSYRLDNERRYRFTNVNRMFVRFEARPGMMFFRGFNFTAKLISPPATFDGPDFPEPESVAPVPNATHTLYLEGVSLSQFVSIREEFRQLIADMAAKYIRENDIDPGLNSTSEVTQITRATICSINWPDYTNCAEVSFGVPLSYDNETNPRLNATELSDMWSRYIREDPFALRLRRMGISEFSPPNDAAVMMVWLVIGFGVLISVVMLVIALWRFNCFEDYTRMPLYSDTDSIIEKRGLDLYPTPHQTLPSLDVDSDHEFDDSTRVDMGGYTNNSYVLDDGYIVEEESSREVNSRDRSYATDV